jgi:hypothetical protein
VISWLIFLVLIACEERYNPQLDSRYENILVVDGMITSAPGPYTVMLSSAVPVNDYTTIPLSGYQVIVSDDVGTTETFNEGEPGVYTTAANGIQGVPGRSYRLTIQSPNGKTYQSDFEKLNQPAGIDSVYPKLEYKSDPYLIYDIAGYQFYIDTEPTQTDSVYYFWSLTSTYQYQADFIIRWIYDGTLKPFTDFDSLRTCWNTVKVKDIFIFSTAGISGSNLEEFPLNYVSTETRELSIRYSLLIEQMIITEAAYNFWHSIYELNSDAGNLYTKQPYQIRGNLYNPDNPDELVLGYFMAAGSTSKRIFVNRPDPPVKMRYPICTLSEADYLNFGTLWLTEESEWPLYATFDINGGNALPNQECLDCRLSDGTIEKPEFWVDE